MNSILEVNTKLTLFDYLAMVEEIVREFFNSENGVYQPQIGNLNAMRLFYNHCVTKSQFDEKYGHDVTDADVMAEIVADNEFIKVFNQSLECNDILGYDFANAYKDAMEIVNVKKTSIGRIASVVNTLINKFSEQILPLITDENIAVFSKIVKDVSSGKLSIDSIADNYINTVNSDNENTNAVSLHK